MPTSFISDVRNIFPPGKELPSQVELLENIQINQYLDKTEDIYHLNLISTQKALEDLAYVLKLDDPDLKGIAWAGLGGIHTYNGDYRSAFAAFNFSLDQPVSDSVKAYILLELSNLIRQLDYKKEAVSILKTALNLTTNKNLVWRIKTSIGLCYKYTEPDTAIKTLKKSARHYKTIGNYYRLTTVLRNIGLLYINLKDFQTAKTFLDESLEIAKNHQLKKHCDNATNDIGWMMIQQKKYGKARTIFSDLIKKKLDHYTLSLALQNLGYLEFECENYRKAISYHSQSLLITTRYGIQEMLIEDYYKLGLSHEKLGEIGLANHFYSLGYQEIEKEIRMRLPLLGYRKKLLDRYINFLKDNQQIPKPEIDSKVFKFALGKSLKDIRNIFHTHLLNLHLSQTKNAPELCRRLGIDTKTYFNYQKKLGLKRDITTKSTFKRNEHFNQYIDSLLHLSWRDANKQFEKDLLVYLLKEYKNNKKRLAEDLGISYIYIIKLTTWKK